MKTRIRILGVLLAVSLLTGCGGSSYDSAATAPMEEPKQEAIEEEYYVTEDAIVEESTAAGVETGTAVSETPQVNRKLIRTFDIQIQTKEFDSVVAGIQTKVNELGGYIEQSSLDSGSAYYSHYNRYSYMTVRIPSNKLDQFVSNVKAE